LHSTFPPATRRVARLCAVLVPLSAGAGTALAADDSLFGDKTDVAVGLGAQLAPRYAGSDDSHLQILPILSVQRGLLFADTTRGAGVQYQTSWGLYAAQSIYYDQGRLQSNSDWRPGSRKLAGMGDVASSLTTRTLLAQDLGNGLSASVEAEFSLRDSASRSRYRAGMEFEALKAGHERLVLDLDTHWGDRHYNQAYFGVSAAQAASSGLPAFRAAGGLYAVSLGATWEHSFDAHWASSLQVTSLRYVDDVSRSPVVERRDAFSATAAITYTY